MYKKCRDQLFPKDITFETVKQHAFAAALYPALQTVCHECLFPDYALENHHFFHTSYLNIPIQEMSESLLAYKAVQNQAKLAFGTHCQTATHKLFEKFILCWVN